MWQLEFKPMFLTLQNTAMLMGLCSLVSWYRDVQCTDATSILKPEESWFFTLVFSIVSLSCQPVTAAKMQSPNYFLHYG